MSSVEDRIAQLERRVALLEGQSTHPELSSNEVRPIGAPKVDPVSVHISNKRYAPSNPSLDTYEDYIWFDSSYTLAADSIPTRAVKGLIEFADLFGEVKFRLQITLNETLTPKVPLKQEGIGFTFNQFMPDHQWMLGTKLDDMKCTFKVTEVLYVDGSNQSFG